MLTQMSTVLTDPLNCYTIKISSESKDCLTQSNGDYNYRDHVYKKSEVIKPKIERKSRQNYNKLCSTKDNKKISVKLPNPYFSDCYVTDYYSSFDSKRELKSEFNTELTVLDSVFRNLNCDFELESSCDNKLQSSSNNKLDLGKKPRSNSLEFSNITYNLCFVYITIKKFSINPIYFQPLQWSPHLVSKVVTALVFSPTSCYP